MKLTMITNVKLTKFSHSKDRYDDDVCVWLQQNEVNIFKIYILS